jgi:hypothetical protein
MAYNNFFLCVAVIDCRCQYSPACFSVHDFFSSERAFWKCLMVIGCGLQESDVKEGAFAMVIKHCSLWIRLQKENPLPNLTLLFCPISSVLFGTD